jgi:hypothetical protein
MRSREGRGKFKLCPMQMVLQLTEEDQELDVDISFLCFPGFSLLLWKKDFLKFHVENHLSLIYNPCSVGRCV